MSVVGLNIWLLPIVGRFCLVVDIATVSFNGKWSEDRFSVRHVGALVNVKDNITKMTPCHASSVYKVEFTDCVFFNSGKVNELICAIQYRHV